MAWLRLVWRSSINNKTRFALTSAGIVASTVLLGVMSSCWHVLYSAGGDPSRSSARIITRHKVSLAFLLPGSYRNTIRAIPGVTHVVPWGFFGGRYKDGAPATFFPQFETDPQEAFDVFSDMKIPPDQLEAWKRDRSGAVVSAGLAKRFGWRIGDHVLLGGTIYPVDLNLTIRGIFDPGDFPQCLLFDWTYVENAVPWANGMAHTYYISTASPALVAQTSAAIDDMFKNSLQPTRTESQKAFQVSFVSMLGNVKAFIINIVGAVLFAITLVTANTIAMSTRERTRQFAVMQTLGFPKIQVVSLIMSEGLLMALIGGVIGVAIAIMVVSFIKQTPQASLLLSRASVTPAIMVCDLGIAVLVGLLSAALPAYGAVRHVIADGLRHL